MTSPLCVDVVVIGGGIAGLSCAAEISTNASVALIEAESQWGYHSTGRSAAVTIPSSGGMVINRLINDSLSFLSTPPQALEIDSLKSMVSIPLKKSIRSKCNQKTLIQY